MTRLQFEELRSKQDLSDLHYPSAKEWMWDYCLFLGKFTDSKGRNYDLGVHYNEEKFLSHRFSNATVYDNYPGSYSSGNMNLEDVPAYVDNNPNIENKTMLDYYTENGFEALVECWNRLQKLKYDKAANTTTGC